MITVVVVTRNCENTIVNCLRSIKSQFSDDSQWELIIVDGLSSDKTKMLACSESVDYKVPVTIVDNENITLASGWNIGIHLAKGDYIIRPDAHSELHPNYITNGLIRLRDNEKLAAVGGTLITCAKTFVGKLVAVVLSNPLGVGRSLFRIGVKNDTYTDTVVYGVYKRQILVKSGGLNEMLTRNQDIDLHKRIKELDFNLLTANDMKANYYSRDSLSKFLLQAWSNGFWITYGETRHLNHLMPLFFVLFMFSVLFLSLKIFAILFLFYFASCVCSYIAFSKIFNPFKLLLATLLTLALHVTYGFASLWGVFKKVLWLK